MTRNELVEKVKLLPYSPGVYMMKDNNGTIIYVGKSKSLRNRVSSYFQPPDRLNVKTAKLAENISDFSCIYTDTEREALILENELIKRHNPKYNIKLKDSKSYPYIKISNAAYPTITLARKRSVDKCKYFGPYTSSKAVGDIIETVNSIFKTADCKKKFEFGKAVCRPCLNYHIGKCIAPCTGKISSSEYKQIFDEVSDFLKGDYVKVISSLQEKMLSASENLKFEAAAQYRDRITALQKLNENQKILSDPNSDRDVFGIFESETICVIVILFIRMGRLIDKEQIFFSSDEITDEQSLFDFVMRYYSTKEAIPKNILLSFHIDDEMKDDLSAFLSEKASYKVDVTTPKKGIKHELTELACENAKQAVEQFSNNLNRNNKILIRISELLCLDTVPVRIEAYDISNNGDKNMYAGMIVVENGNFKKSDYRCFSIKYQAGIDDYSAMREAISRRLTKYRDCKNGTVNDDSFSKLPDLILLDGGKGHVSVISDVIQGFGYPIDLFGMVKDSFHKTRTLTDGENEISIASHKDIFTFIYKIQEEVHRYTFSKMDNSRRKTVKRSTLENINGIGKEKAKLLMNHFGTLSKIKNASVDEISSVKSINEQTANKIFEYFHKKEGE